MVLLNTYTYNYVYNIDPTIQLSSFSIEIIIHFDPILVSISENIIWIINDFPLRIG